VALDSPYANWRIGQTLGRELEIADLIAFICREGIRNIVWLTADVHYRAAHGAETPRARPPARGHDAVGV